MAGATTSQLEMNRVCLEEVEAIESLIVDELDSVKRRSHRAVLAQELRIRNLLRGAQDRAKRLRATVEAQPQGGLQEFLRRKELLADFFERYPDAVVQEDARWVARKVALGGDPTAAAVDGSATATATTNEDEEALAVAEEKRKLFRPKNRLERRQARARLDDFVLSRFGFTGEEHFGRYADLHEFYLLYKNLDDAFSSVSYLDYIRSRLAQHLPPPALLPAAATLYAQYVARLRAYLEEFEARARPLGGSAKRGGSANSERPFETQLLAANSASDLETALSLSQLKEALEARGLKAGGTLAQRAQRLFAVKGLAHPDEFPEELRASTTKNKAGLVVAPAPAKVKQDEAAVKAILARLKDVLQATGEMVTKKLTMTYEEIENELREEEAEAGRGERSDEESGEDGEGGDEDGDESKFKQYGVVDPGTGRVIPKWMHKLHGLHLEFKCEICGNHSYFGRRAYDRHFKDYRHANGMKALGIPNTLHFHDITSIAEAQKLYATLRREVEKTEFNKAGDQEEFEDTAGNVMSRRTYEDMKREGLL